ncbi:hypothetical protein BH11PSE7_BH11PSE7_18700 [soil metagenome]
MTNNASKPAAAEQSLTSFEAARALGLAVRSVQLMVDRGELTAWKTPGGHRRIAGESVDKWLRANGPGRDAAHEVPRQAAPRVLLIEDSLHFQNQVRLLVTQAFPGVELHIVGDAIAGLVQCGRLQPDVLIVDLQLPGIDGATLITSLRSQPGFDASQLIVVTALDDAALAPYAFALEGVGVVRKQAFAQQLPALLAGALRMPAQERT